MSVSQAFSLVHSHIIVLMFCNCSLFCNKVSSQIVLTSKGFSVFFWITLSHEVSRHFPPPPTQPYQHMQTLRTFCIFTVHWWIYPFIGGESDVLWKEEKQIRFWIVSSRLHPYSNFPKHSRKSHTVQCEPNPGRSPHTDSRLASTTKRYR